MSKLGLLAVRAHSGPVGGYGHAMRCLAIAQEWAARGGSVALVTDTSSSMAVRDRWIRAGFAIRDLHVTPGTLEDADKTIEASHDADFVVLDGYCFSSDFQQMLARTNRVLCIDDCAHSSPYSAQIVLSQDIGYDGPIHLRNAGLTEWVLSGPKYILLRSEFRQWSSFNRPAPQLPIRVLLTAGGSDTELLMAFISAADEVNRYRRDIRAIVMASSESLERLPVDLDDYDAGIVRNVEDVATVMSRVDYAISAGGTTLLELAFMGIPTFAIAAAPSQLPMIQELVWRGVVYSDLVSLLSSDILHGTLVAFMHLLSPLNEVRRTYTNRAGRQLIDGCGARRVVDVMESYLR